MSENEGLKKLEQLIDLLKSKDVYEFKDGSMEIKIQLQPKIEYYEKEPEATDIVDDDLLFRSAE